MNRPRESPNAKRTAAETLARSFVASSLFSRKLLWVWPIIAAVLLGVVGWWVRSAIEDKLKADLASKLQTILDADVTALRLWMRTQETAAASVAVEPDVVALSEKLIAKAADRQLTQLELLQAPEQQALREQLNPVLDARGYEGFILLDKSKRIIASRRNELVGLQVALDDQAILVEKVFQGQTAVTAPRKSQALLPAKDGTLKAGVPTMFAWSPVFGASREVVAVLGLRIPPAKEFTEILGIARSGKTGETYAFNQDARLVSQSRFDDDLRRIGLLTEDEDSILNVQLRDPGVDLTQGQRPATNRSEQPLTRMAESAVKGNAGVDVNGYRDYRGVATVGAWTWLEEFGLGVATKQDAAEAFAVLNVLRVFFWSLFALLAAASLAIFVFTLMVARLQRDAQVSALELRRLGQYTLGEKIGEGGMGAVYRATHAMLHRPTAVKLLPPDKVTEKSIVRFEREVQVTSQLTHPNTIAIYDYGRTPEGLFYYAMECIDGITLEDLVGQRGPLCDGRVIPILQQICGSLGEAHRRGLIHRDIKPGNILICDRGGVLDFIKVLDFGLVRAIDGDKQAAVTSPGAVAGTPHYMSPESCVHPEKADARSDLYAVGAVGYFLLTGQTIFDGDSVMEILRKQSKEIPKSPTQCVTQSISKELETLILKCLEKSPDARPQSAESMIATLSACQPTIHWNIEDARSWWHVAETLDSPMKKTNDEVSNTDATVIVIKDPLETDQWKTNR